MRMAKRRALLLSAGLSLMLAACGSANGSTAGSESGSTYPSKPITILVGSAAGSGVDVMARQAATQLKSQLDTPIAVRNMTGGDGATLMTYLKAQPADSYTIGVDARGQLIALNTSLSDQFSIDDWTFLAEMETDPYVLAVRSQSPIKTFDDFVAAAKSKPLSVGGYGANSAQRLVQLKIDQETGTTAKWVPFDGGSESVTNLLGGHIDATVTNAGQVSQLAKAGKLRVLAVASNGPLAALPGAPTFADVGHPSVTVPHWRGFYVKSGTPQAVVDKLVKALTDLANDPGWKSQVEKSGQVAEFTAGEEWSKQVHADFEDMQPLLKQAGLMK